MKIGIENVSSMDFNGVVIYMRVYVCIYVSKHLYMY
jgi:hypothetical protein